MVGVEGRRRRRLQPSSKFLDFLCLEQFYPTSLPFLLIRHGTHLESSPTKPSSEVDPKPPLPMSLRLYPLSNYSFAVKGAQIEEDASVNARLLRL